MAICCCRRPSPCPIRNHSFGVTLFICEGTLEPPLRVCGAKLRVPKPDVHFAIVPHLCPSVVTGFIRHVQIRHTMGKHALVATVAPMVTHPKEILAQPGAPQRCQVPIRCLQRSPWQRAWRRYRLRIHIHLTRPQLVWIWLRQFVAFSYFVGP